MYSLGVLLFELLTLKRPFDGEDLTRVRDDAINAPVPELPEGVSPEMSKLVDSLMAKDPEQRPDAGDVLALPIMKLLTSALLEVAHSSQVDIPESEREQIIADVERVRRQMRPPRPVPRVLQPQLMSIAPSSSLSVSASPNMTTGSSFPEQVSDDCIFMESMVWKGSGDGNWKRRYLSLIRNSASGQVELLLSVAKSALGSQCIRKSITDFDDVFAVPTRYTNPPLPFSFALMTSNGKKLAFRAESQEDLDAWISHISYMLHQVSLPVTSSSQTFPGQSGQKSELE
jgi:protein kinase